MAKIGRNTPCPCGSGKKYKKCCLGLDLCLILLDSHHSIQNWICFQTVLWI
ncbi:SEC-C metal-binding domain-containing protein [uncultured Desulfobacter sp.]|uniref:SEC-C metal-binding domain-containing protein n=1 Tax=uncultured Desulfobacter sp. TaxID=240139 RepID=UPI0029F5A87F|nr:SEC-C metal-binding domain-containing protein [uncultured Desulfobacter sp.]